VTNPRVIHDVIVWAGPDCYANVMRAGDAGYKHDKHYVRFFPMRKAE
jgi:hypothetical protein